MMYKNFRFKNLKHNDSVVSGSFESADLDVYCDFIFYMNDMTIDVFNNNKPVDEIMPLPVWWLIRKLRENGELKESESRQCN